MTGRGPVDRDRLGEYLEGRLPEVERNRYEEQLLRDPELAGELYEELGVRELLHRRTARRRPVRRLYWLAPLAAAAVILLMMLPSGEPEVPVLRGEIAPLEVVEPRGEVDGEFVLRWRSVDGASSYLVEIFSAETEPLLSGTTADTALAVAGIDTGGEGFWRVTARDELARPVARSAPTPIRTRP